ncbi:MAG: tetratricopeptide repeat protein [Anaerolineae bacterium]|nr:tetratricopeptide repeat protein [Anaerolineae bacterium]
MKQKGISRILVVIIALVAVAGVALYWVNRTPRPEDSQLMPTAVSAPTATAIANAAVSPISPLSQVSPPPAVTADSDPAQTEVLLNSGIALYEKQDYQGAIKIFDEILSTDPKNALAYNARGSAYLDLKDYDKAVADYTKAIELETLLPHAYYNRGRAYTLLKKYDNALADLQHSAQLLPAEFGYRANGNIGLIYHQQGEYARALDAFATAISFDDSKADTYYLRGETYTAMENYEAAINDYQAALSRFPNYNQAYQGLGYASYKIGHFAQAQETLNKALEISSNSPMTHFYLMLVYLATEQLDPAKAEVSLAMDNIGALSEEEQNSLFKRVLADLETFVQENPAKDRDAKALINLIPEPQ